MTQAQVTDLLNQLLNRYNGQHPDYWGYPGECLSYTKRWVDVLKNGRLDGAMQAPSSNNGYGTGYWVSPPALVQELFIKQAYDPNATYPAGSMFIYMATGHIGILLDNQPGNPNALVSEQNADPDGSPVHTAQRSKSRINGILVIKVEAPVIQPVPTQGAVEMINTREEAIVAYKLLRPNYNPNEDEINATAGRRSWLQFVNDGQREREQRDAALLSQQQALGQAQVEAQNLRSTIIRLNQVKEQEDISEAQKDQRLAELGNTLNATSMELQKALLEVERLNDTVCKVPEPKVDGFTLFEKFLALFQPKPKA